MPGEGWGGQGEKKEKMMHKKRWEGSIKPSKDSIQPLKRFYQAPKAVQLEPPFGPRKFVRTLVKGSPEPQTGFFRTSRIEPPPFQVIL